MGRPATSRSVFQPSPGNDGCGLTLLELLVVLVLASLLGTLVIQGTGFFLGRYEAVARDRRVSSLALLQRHWFVSTVRGMVPSFRGGRRFRGGGTSFEGVTLRPLAKQSGRPVPVQWVIDRSDDGSSVVGYAEDGRAEWTVLTLTEPGVAFQYADSAGRWHDDWPSNDRPTQGIPRMVRLVSEMGRTLWLARTDLFPQPVKNFRDFS